jgi:hypothetical protein
MTDQARSPLADRLDTLLIRLQLGNLSKTLLKRLTGGANQETWAFDAIDRANVTPLILRRLSDDALPSEDTVTPECEAHLIRCAGECGVPTATVRHILEPRDNLGGVSYPRVSKVKPWRAAFCGMRRSPTYAPASPSSAARSSRASMRCR